MYMRICVHVDVATSVCGYNYAHVHVPEHSVCIHFQYTCTCLHTRMDYLHVHTLYM